MKKILAVTSGKLTPSARFRIRQHIKYLNNNSIFIKESCPLIEKNKSVPFLSKYNPRYYLPIYFIWQLLKCLQRIPMLIRAKNYDYVWLNRELVTGYFTFEYCLKRKIILDVDDAIWLNPPFGKSTARKLAKYSRKIVCGNEYLADWFRQYNKHVYIVPTAVDTDLFRPKDEPDETIEDITLGWIGTHGNLKYLEYIMPAINEVLEKNKNVFLTVICDQEPEWVKNNEKIKYKEWSEQEEVYNFQNISVGLMPLFEDEWTKGKCSFKLLQHLSCGAVVVGSPVGMNKNILLGDKNGAYPAKNTHEWKMVLQKLIDNYPELKKEKGLLARNFIINNYSSKKVREMLLEIFKDD